VGEADRTQGVLGRHPIAPHTSPQTTGGHSLGCPGVTLAYDSIVRGATGCDHGGRRFKPCKYTLLVNSVCKS
jgi:hypothetical protein